MKSVDMNVIFCNLEDTSGHVLINCHLVLSFFKFFWHINSFISLIFLVQMLHGPLSFQMNRPIQVKPADSESRGGKRHTCPPTQEHNTCPNKNSFTVQTTKLSILTSHLVWHARLRTCFHLNYNCRLLSAVSKNMTISCHIIRINIT